MKQLYNTIAILGTLSVIVILSIVMFTESEDGLLAEIQKLENSLLIKDVIILDQMKTINNMEENYKRMYENFSLEKFPATGGFNPEWLEGERTKILQGCQDAKAMGYEQKVCKYL